MAELNIEHDQATRQEVADAIEDAQHTLTALSDKLDALTDRLPGTEPDTVDAHLVYSRGRLEGNFRAIHSAASALREQVQEFVDATRSSTYPAKLIRNYAAWMGVRENSCHVLSTARDGVFTALAQLEAVADTLTRLTVFAEHDVWPDECHKARDIA